MGKPVPPPAASDDPRVQAFARLLSVVDALRAPDDGCPWDLEQSEASMAPRLVEEAHEVLDAIEGETAEAAAAEEGDVMTALLMICRIAQDGGRYDAAEAAHAAADKLVRRHGHVFGDGGGDLSPEEVLGAWESAKRREREARTAPVDVSALTGIPKGLPALQRAGRVCQKAVAAGFHWKVARGALAKLEEELDELREVLPEEALARDARPELEAEVRVQVEHELGDVLMAAAFLGGYLDLEPETLLRAALRRFEGRFRHMEQALGGSLAGHDLDAMMAAWTRAKDVEQSGASPGTNP